MNTPDTEWREDFRNKILDIETAIRLTYNEKDSDAMVAKMTDYIATLLSSRDTYWKERVRKIAEGMKKNPNKEAEWYGDDAGWEAQGWNNALDTLLDNLK